MKTSSRLEKVEPCKLAVFFWVFSWLFSSCFPWNIRPASIFLSLCVLCFQADLGEALTAGGCLVGTGKPGQGLREREAENGTCRREEQHRRGRRPDAWDAGGVRCGEVCGLISLKASPLTASSNDYKQGLCFGVSHPGERLASGRFSEDSYKGDG